VRSTLDRPDDNLLRAIPLEALADLEAAPKTWHGLRELGGFGPFFLCKLADDNYYRVSRGFVIPVGC
jgi:hypothetical protein